MQRSPVRGGRRWDCRGHTDSPCFSFDFSTPLHALQRQRVSRDSTDRKHLSQKPSLSPSPADRAQGLLWAPKAPVSASDTSSLQLVVVSLYISSSPAEMFLQGRHCVYYSPALFPPHLAQHSKYLNEGMNIGFFGDLELLLSFMYSLIIAMCPDMVRTLEIQRWNVHG